MRKVAMPRKWLALSLAAWLTMSCVIALLLLSRPMFLGVIDDDRLGVISSDGSGYDNLVCHPTLPLIAVHPTDTAASDYIEVWNVQTRTLVAKSRLVTNGPIAFSSDGRSILYDSRSSVREWSFRGDVDFHLFDTPGGGIVSISCSPDGRVVATSERDRRCRVWRRDTGALQNTIDNDAHVEGIRFSKDKPSIITYDSSGLIHEWSYPGLTLLGSMVEHEGSVWDVQYTEGGRSCVSVGYDGLIRKWDLSTYECVWTVHSVGNATSLVEKPQDFSIFAEGPDGHVRRWNSEGELIHTYSGLNGVAVTLGMCRGGYLVADGEEVSIWAIE